jgi:hypothetical protein
MLEAVSQPFNAFPTLTAVGSGGACSGPLVLQDAVFQDAYYLGTAPPATVLGSRFVYCDGVLPAYLLTVGSSAAYQAALIDPAAGGVTRDLSGSTVNAASFAPAISPGGLVSIFGTGLSGAGNPTTASIGGQPATVLLATPFQINAQVSPAVSPGDSTIQITSAFGTQSQAVTIQAVGPGIFAIGTASDGVSERLHQWAHRTSAPGQHHHYLLHRARWHYRLRRTFGHQRRSSGASLRNRALHVFRTNSGIHWSLPGKPPHSGFPGAGLLSLQLKQGQLLAIMWPLPSNDPLYPFGTESWHFDPLLALSC